jgi:integrase/recombinase XerD
LLILIGLGILASRLGISNQREHTKNSSSLWFKGKTMSQAKVLSATDTRKILIYISSHKHAVRNRCMFLCTTQLGMRICEVANLKIASVLNTDGSIRDEIHLSADQTKGSKGRTIIVSKKMQEEFKAYLQDRFQLKDLLAVTMTDTSRALFCNQKNYVRGFSNSTLCQTFHYIYKGAKVDGSSHSGRRGYITTLANKGVGVRLIMELVGHKSMSVTQKYIDVNPTMLRSAAELI